MRDPRGNVGKAGEVRNFRAAVIQGKAPQPAVPRTPSHEAYQAWQCYPFDGYSCRQCEGHKLGKEKRFVEGDFRQPAKLPEPHSVRAPFA
jgi:hypothetical protein